MATSCKLPFPFLRGIILRMLCHPVESHEGSRSHTWEPFFSFITPPSTIRFESIRGFFNNKVVDRRCDIDHRWVRKVDARLCSSYLFRDATARRIVLRSEPRCVPRTGDIRDTRPVTNPWLVLLIARSVIKTISASMMQWLGECSCKWGCNLENYYWSLVGSVILD